MSQASSSNTVSNLRPERVVCRVCGLDTVVMVSGTELNPGRLFYSCPSHGFVRWVGQRRSGRDGDFIPTATVSAGRTEGHCDVIGHHRIPITARRDSTNATDSGHVCNSSAIVWALTVTNLLSIAANLINMFKN